MASWSGFSLTNLGLALEAKINTGACDMEFTKMAIGSGTASGSLESLTELVEKQMDLTISSISQDSNIVTLKSVITNEGVTTAFYAREMGLYATDPDEGEILFAYQTDPEPDSIPAAGTATVVSEEFVAHLVMSNTSNVSAILNPANLVTVEDLTAAIEEHNTSGDSHADIRAAIEAAIDQAVTGVSYSSGTLTVSKGDGTSSTASIPSITALYTSGNTGYALFSNNFIIQWGRVENLRTNASSVTNTVSVTLPHAMANTNHSTTATVSGVFSGTTPLAISCRNESTAQISITCLLNSTADAEIPCRWLVIGTAAS